MGLSLAPLVLLAAVGCLNTSDSTQKMVEMQCKETSDVNVSCDLTNLTNETLHDLLSIHVNKKDRAGTVKALALVDTDGERVTDVLHLFKDMVNLEAKLETDKGRMRGSFLRLGIPIDTKSNRDIAYGKYECQISYRKDEKLTTNITTCTESFNVREGSKNSTSSGLSLTCEDRRRENTDGKASVKGNISIMSNNEELASVQFPNSEGAECPRDRVSCWLSSFTTYAALNVHLFKNGSGKFVCRAYVESNVLEDECEIPGDSPISCAPGLTPRYLVVASFVVVLLLSAWRY